jgi:hypothetical protein
MIRKSEVDGQSNFLSLSVSGVVQADSGGAVIFDPGSSNGSKIDGVRMKPNIRYGYRGICVHHLLLPLSGIQVLL